MSFLVTLKILGDMALLASAASVAPVVLSGAGKFLSGHVLLRTGYPVCGCFAETGCGAVCRIDPLYPVAVSR